MSGVPVIRARAGDRSQDKPMAQRRPMPSPGSVVPRNCSNYHCCIYCFAQCLVVLPAVVRSCTSGNNYCSRRCAVDLASDASFIIMMMPTPRRRESSTTNEKSGPRRRYRPDGCLASSGCLCNPVQGVLGRFRGLTMQ